MKCEFLLTVISPRWGSAFLGTFCAFLEIALFFSFWYYDLTSVLFYLRLFYYINLTFTYKKLFYFLVEFNGTRAIGDFTPYNRTLVY
jgi:hypothetical protein